MNAAGIVLKHPSLWDLADFYRLAFIFVFGSRPSASRVDRDIRRFKTTGHEPGYVKKYATCFKEVPIFVPDLKVWRTYG